MGSYEGIAAVVNDLARVKSAIGSPAAEELEALLLRFVESADDVRDDVAGEITRLMVAVLPTDDPAYEEFVDKRLGISPARTPILFAVRRTLGLPVAGSPKERILRSAHTSAITMRGRGADPELPDLIRLDRADGSVSLPDFQFDERSEPYQVVVRVNRVLDAQHDPWGVADWWLSSNVWLGDRPAELLGRVDDDDLVAAATAAVEG